MTEPDIPKQSSKSILFQFVLFPLGIALIAVAVFYLFGKMATQEQSVPDYLNEIRSGSSHERWQAAYQLSKSLDRGEAKKTPDLEPRVARYHRTLAEVYHRAGQHQEALAELNRALELDPEGKVYRDLLTRYQAAARQAEKPSP